MLKVTDRWTTRDGEWFTSDKPYAINPWALERHKDEDIPGKGGANHIFVRVPVGSEVIEFNTGDGQNKTQYAIPPVHPDRWVSHPMFHSSSYNPDDGSVGPWLVRIDGEKVAEGIGLPHSWHVSSFLVVEDVEPVVVPDPPVKDTDSIRLIINGVTVYSN